MERCLANGRLKSTSWGQTISTSAYSRPISGLTNHSSRRLRRGLAQGVRPHMKKPLVLCLLVLALLTSCATVPDDCSSLAATGDGWRPISPPSNASELVALLPDTEPGPLHWYGRGSNEYRIASCAPCKGVAYELQLINGAWVAEADALSYCHPGQVRPD
jgi:hypothetical protein